MIIDIWRGHPGTWRPAKTEKQQHRDVHPAQIPPGVATNSAHHHRCRHIRDGLFWLLWCHQGKHVYAYNGKLSTISA